MERSIFVAVTLRPPLGVGDKKSAKLTTYGQPVFSRFHGVRISVYLVIKNSDEPIVGLVGSRIGRSRYEDSRIGRF
jgi:hypothetical protein